MVLGSSDPLFHAGDWLRSDFGVDRSTVPLRRSAIGFGRRLDPTRGGREAVLRHFGSAFIGAPPSHFGVWREWCRALGCHLAAISVVAIGGDFGCRYR
jgi:hypothetical protein